MGGRGESGNLVGFFDLRGEGYWLGVGVGFVLGEGGREFLLKKKSF